jgi:two-component system, chemotaxis family, chemotaxis protein CheY
MRTILARIMKAAGFEIEQAENGEAALSLLGVAAPFHIAMIDWNMPVMNGLELIRRVRGEERYREMRIMMVTTESEPAQVARALLAGADEFVMKPFSDSIIVEKLELLGVSQMGPA